MKIRTPLDIGRLIASIRKTNKISQTQLAQRIGKDQRFVSKLENDPSTVALSTVMTTLVALGIDIDLSTPTIDSSTSERKIKKPSNEIQKTSIAKRTYGVTSQQMLRGDFRVKPLIVSAKRDKKQRDESKED